jgi:hypothetical protein
VTGGTGALPRIIVLVLAVVGAVSLMVNVFDVEFGTGNYWDRHGVFFLLFITLFPRLTLLFSSVAAGGVLWWLGFIFTPRLLVALLATVAYWEANPVLVLLSWMVAFSGELGEKYVVSDRVRVVVLGESSAFHRRPAPHRGTTIEGEFRRMD